MDHELEIIEKVNDALERAAEILDRAPDNAYLDELAAEIRALKESGPPRPR